MIAIVLLGLLASTSASPRWRHNYRHGPPSPFDDSFERYFDEYTFDTNRFWNDFSRNIQMRVDQMLDNINRQFPSLDTTVEIKGNEYIIVVPLPDYEEKDIHVKAREGLLMIQAVHKSHGEADRNYLHTRYLPACVGEQGSWSYEKGVLTIILPIIQSEDESKTVVSSTPTPDNSNVETEKPILNPDQNVDEDVRGDLAKTNVLLNNNIPKQKEVEATTYAIDLKDEVEFVPVRY